MMRRDTKRRLKSIKKRNRVYSNNNPNINNNFSFKRIFCLFKY